MNKAHSPINWENYPNETTPINEENLNKMDRAIGIIDDRVIEHENKKLSKADASLDIVNVEYDKDTSVFQFTKRNGETVKVDVSSVVVREGYTKEESDQRYANAIKRTYSGETIAATDSAEAKFEGLRVFGKSEQVQTTGAQLFDINGDIDESSSTNYKYILTLKPNTSYTLSSNVPQTETASLYFNGSSTASNGVYDGKARTTKTDDAGNLYISIRHSSTGTSSIALYDAVLNGTYWIMLNEGDTALPYEPYTNKVATPNSSYPQPIESVGDDGSVDVLVFKKNYIQSTAKNLSKYGVNFVVNDDKSITVNGTATGTVIFEVSYNMIPKGDYYISGGCDGGSNTTYQMTLTGPATKYVISSNAYDFKVTEAQKARVRIYVYSGATVSNLTFKPMIYKQSESGEYDGVSSQELIISTPNGLPAIKVTDRSLATYTDADGVMWVADEIDFASGKYVKRIGTKVFDGSEKWYETSHSNAFTSVLNNINNVTLNYAIIKCFNTHYIGETYRNLVEQNDKTVEVFAGSNGASMRVKDSSISSTDEMKAFVKNLYDNGTPMKCMYAYKTPIETDLTAEEIEAYRALHSNYPTTTILNDENAHMEVTLVADTKNHIEQNYVPVTSYNSLVERVIALEQRALA